MNALFYIFEIFLIIFFFLSFPAKSDRDFKIINTRVSFLFFLYFLTSLLWFIFVIIKEGKVKEEWQDLD